MKEVTHAKRWLNNKGEDEESGNFTNIWYSNFLFGGAFRRKLCRASTKYLGDGRRANILLLILSWIQILSFLFCQHDFGFEF